MQNPGDDEGYAGLIPKDGGKYGWRNAVTVGSMARTLLYRPLNHVAEIRSPTLYIAAEHDTLCPAASCAAAVQKNPKIKLLVIPKVGHFDMYQGEILEQVLAKTVGFFQEHLKQR